MLVLLAACTGKQKNGDASDTSRRPFKITKATAHTVPSDSLRPLVPVPAGKPVEVAISQPHTVTANLNVHPVPASIPSQSLAELQAPTIIIPGKTPGYAEPVVIKHTSKTIPAGIPEVVVVKDAYTKDVNPGNFSSFIKLQGLKHGNVNSVLQDRRGNLWFGTDGGGLTCYDGKYFTHFTEATGLPNNVVRTAVEDSKGRLWMGTDAGLSCYDGETFTNFALDMKGLTSNVIRTILEDDNGHLWLGSDGGGLLYYDGTQFVNYTRANGLVSDMVYALAIDKKGRLWIGTKNGLSVFNGNVLTSYTTQQDFSNKTIRALMNDRKGNTWVGTEGDGLYCFGEKTLTHYTEKEGLNYNEVISLMQDKQGDIWIGTEGHGIAQYNGKSFTHFTDKQGLSSNTVLNAFQDRAGTVWLGTYGGGVTRYDGKIFTHYTETEGLSNNVVRSILHDSKGNTWFGTNGGGATCYDGETFYWYTQEQGLSNNVVRCMMEDHNQDIWLGTHGGGVCIFDGKLFWRYTTEQGLGHNIVRSIFQDSKKNIWFGTYGGGVTKFDGKNFTTINTKNGLSHNVILCITEDKNGTMWFGTEGGGLTAYDGKTFKHYTTAQGLPNNEVWSIVINEKGDFWMATGGGGVVYFNGKSFVQLDMHDGLSNDFVFSVMPDKKDNLWFGTRFGLNKLSPENARFFEEVVTDLEAKGYTTETKQVYFKSYTYEDGFLGIGCFGNALCEDRDGTIWIGSNDRLTAYHPQGDAPDNMAPDIQLKGIDIFNEEITWPYFAGEKGENKDTAILLGNGVSLGNFTFKGLSKWYGVPNELSLAHNNNYLTFKFIGITQRQPNRVKYQYKLEGLDENWSALVNRTEAPYGNLPHGNYTFRVKAMNSEGIWSKEFKYNFSIRPPWWKTIWFRILLGLFIVVSLYVFYSWRVASLRRRQRLLEQTVKKRTAEVVHQKDEAEKQKKRAEQQKELVEQKQREITDSINYAKRIQEAILPPESMVKQHLPGSFILYRPKDIVAGDFYFFEMTATHLFCAAADCTGHGVPGAMVSVVCANALTRCVKEFKLTDPGMILDKARELVIETFEKSGQDVKDGMDISLISLRFKAQSLKLDERSEITPHASNPLHFKPGTSNIELLWSGANNPLWYFHEGEIMEIKPDKQPIGKTYDPKPFTTHRLNLPPESFLFLFTDGYADQFGGETGKKLKYKNLKKILRSAIGLKDGEQAPFLDHTFEDWRGKLEQVDDVCIIGVKL